MTTSFLISLAFSLLFQVVSSSDRIYLDVETVNTTSFLESVRLLPLSFFRLAHDKDRRRVGVLGHELARIIPDAVSILPNRTLPTLKNSGESQNTRTLRNFPSVNEPTVFMYSVGATQELAKLIDRLQFEADDQMQKMSSIFEEVSRFEQLLSLTTGENSTLRMKEAALKATIKKAETDMKLLRALSEQELAEKTRVTEKEQLKRSEEMTMARIKRQDAAARLQAERTLLAKFEASQRTEKAKIEAAEAVAAMEKEKRILFQKASEEMKVRSAKAIANAKAAAERANEDVHLRRLQAESEQRRKRNIAAINAVFTHLSTSLTNAVHKPKEVLTLVGYICLIVSSIFFARETSKLIRSIFESFIGRPQLVRETTRTSMPWSLFAYTKLLITLKPKRDSKSIEETFSDLILPQELKTRVVELAHSVRNANRHDAPYRHVLLYGPPGTGKTLVAKKLAQVIGIDYALMSGGDVSPLGTDAVTQIHSLFAWAKRSQKGVLLFIDEAECFLGSRDSGLMTSTAHNALNALLYNTGGDRRDFMLVIATNRAEDLDSAVLDRCDETIFFPLPDEECRRDLISLYFDLHCLKFMDENNLRASTLKSRITHYFTKQRPLLMSVDSDLVEGKHLKLHEAVLKRVVKDTQGFSGRAISKLAIAWQAAVYGTDDTMLDKNTFFSTVKNHKDGMKQKEKWSK